MSKPRLVGVTGGIGSGKSTVCKIFESLGVKSYYADDKAKELMETSPALIREIKTIFGEEAYVSGNLNRQEIAKKAFQEKSLLDRLNEAVHPAVKLDFEEWVEANSTDQLLLKEAALLIETGSYKELDSLIVVVAEEQKRIDRVLERDSHRSEEDVRKIISKQLSDEQRKSEADFLINNDGNISLICQVMDIYPKL